jgi:putative DNA primase/helicase
MTQQSLVSTREAAQGRWREILPAVGVEIRWLNGKHQPCPMCGGKDRFRFDDKDGTGSYFCSGCGAGKGFTLLKRLKGWDFRQAANEVDRVICNLPAGGARQSWAKPVATKEALNALWQSSRRITPEDPAGRYMAARRLTADGASRVLRFVPSLEHNPTRTRHPGMVALFSDANGKARQIQRTYLTEQGSKADLKPNRMFMPGEMPDGGAIRLGEAAEAMGVAEGIETALAAAQRFSMPVWAATSANMLEKWQPPPEAKRITVFGDNDASFTGQAAAYELAKRLVHEAVRDKVEREVQVLIPPRAGTDWADEALSAWAKGDGERAEPKA